ncbi:uncharacterized protein LOC103497866 isoform X2 [Cucumis melo]|uniref:Uncharacterized protein LOC103497866 isoform X2 n=1 Tax=Cucumis melo TaxID=3656 RepID=A0ABM3LCR6_CUCME|nr:uncharacterized protein LOC103497866 isoform X2 [Cucumis melo]
MDLVKENYQDIDGNEDGSPEQSVSQENSEICDEFSDPEISPRVGEEYQVEVPPLLLKSDINWLQSCKEAEIQDSSLHDFFVGLPVQVMWISEEAHWMERKLHEDKVEKCSRKEDLKGESFQDEQKDDSAKSIIEATKMTTSSKIKVSKAADLALPKETVLATDTDQKDNINGFHLVPGVSGEPWSNIEEASFLLGLYIFGKNLVLVKKFVGSKQMGDILSFYYGRFYQSEKYCRWCECRKTRGRKCVYGQRLFKGWRQQELVSRLLLHVAEDNKNALMEVTKSFGDGKFSFEEFVFALKATVGLEAFVDAVGIGKEKQDLTSVSMDPVKSNHGSSLRPEIPTGKACSALTPLEIVNYLTGDFRLSKARSSDLFWEAVWPRLLARGWHSEQPSNGFTAGMKHSLVFLVPGIKKFSRRKLVRGNHYFDSVSDVLGKVALDPGLLELDNNVDKDGKSNEENGWTDDSKVDQEEFPSQQRHCYLKPRTPANTDILKFTIVDTSLANGSASKIRELRSLPVDLLTVSSSRSYFENHALCSSSESMEESDSEEDQCVDKAETANTSQALRKNKKQKVISNGHYSPSDVSKSKQVLPVSCKPDSMDSPAEVLKDHSCIKLDGTQSQNGIVHPFSQKSRLDIKRKPTNVTKKRRKLNTFGLKCTSNISVASKPKEEDACCKPKEEDSCCKAKEEDSCCKPKEEDSCCKPKEEDSCCKPEEEDSCCKPKEEDSYCNPKEEDSCCKPKEEDAYCSKDGSDTSKNILPSGDLLQEKSSSSSGCSPISSLDGNPKEIDLNQSRALIDLNLPVPLDAETDEPVIMHMRRERPDQTSKEPNDPSVAKTSEVVQNVSDQQLNMNSRRVSSRNRPPTTRALEARALGLLDVKQKRKHKDPFLEGNLIVKPPRRGCPKNGSLKASFRGSNLLVKVGILIGNQTNSLTKQGTRRFIRNFI